MTYTFHEPHFAVVSGAGDVVAAKAGYRIRVFAVGVTGATQFTSGAGATALTGAAMTSNFNSVDQRDGLFQTAVGDKLSHVGAGVGYIAYVLVKDNT